MLSPSSFCRVNLVPFAGAFLTLVATAALADAPPKEATPVRIFAAASVGDVVERVAAAEVGAERVSMSVASTSTLARQVLEGAAVDLFVSANLDWMERLVAAGKVDPESVRILATNRLVVAVAQGAAPVARFEFPPGRVALGEAHVPLGQASDATLVAAGLQQRLDGRTVRAPSARVAREWVATGEVAAGVLYASDVGIDPRLQTAWTFAPEFDTDVYVVAGVAHTNSSAPQILNSLGGPVGRAAFSAASFLPPPQDVAAATLPATPLTLQSVDPVAAILRSLSVAALALVACSPLSVAAGYFLARRRRRGRWGSVGNLVVSATLLIPLALPPVVTGWMLLVLLGKRGLNTSLPFTVWACVIASAVVAIPLFTLTARAAFDAVDPRLEELASTLGVPPRRTFLAVTLPLAFPGLVAGALLAFARGLGEYGATVVVAGNTEGTTRTLALAVEALLHSPSSNNAIGTLVTFSIVTTVAVVAGYELLLGWQRRRLGGQW